MDKWCEHNDVQVECVECRLALAEAQLEYQQIRAERRSAPRHALLHRLRRYRDTIDPDQVHSCHAGCLRTDCLIVSALKYIEGYDDDRQAEV